MSKDCLHCGTTFHKKPTTSLASWLGNKRRPNGVRFCSKQCTDLHPRSKETCNKMRESHLGQRTWNTGLTKETDSRVGYLRPTQFVRGHKKSPETRARMIGRNMGELNNKWKGGITPIHHKIRNSPRYKEWRLSIFERDDYTCQHCDQKGGDLNADHIKPFAFYPKLRFDLDNGRTLCVPCHRKTPTYGRQKATVSTVGWT